VSILAAIEAELERLHDTPEHVAEDESFGVNDEHDGWTSLGASEHRHDLYWYGKAEELLERLRRLPDAGGPAAVREEFRSRFPG
jgi:hypothetical protein